MANPLSAADREFLTLAIQVARHARTQGQRPFGSILVGPDGDVLVEAHNLVLATGDCTQHAETNVVRLATPRYPLDFLTLCTLYASTEPCPMCTAAIYLSGIGRIVYALPASELAKHLAGLPEAKRPPSLSWPCIEMLARENRPVEVLGDFLRAEADAVHEGFWWS
jgi:tRNA(Arg) A34 adenosine deaminase TadA